MNTQDIVLPLADFIVWTFESILEPIGNILSSTGWEIFWAAVAISGIGLWLRLQGKYNKEAQNNPDQIK